MNKTHLFRASLALAAVAFGAAHLSADVVETKSGARIVGKVSKIDGGAVVVETSYAGAITIKQSEVAGITTDAPVAVRLETGTRIDGKISGAAGSLQIAGPDGTISTTVDQVVSTWAVGGKDPQLAALDRGWAYEANVDIAGVEGAEQVGHVLRAGSVFLERRRSLPADIAQRGQLLAVGGACGFAVRGELRFGQRR